MTHYAMSSTIEDVDEDNDFQPCDGCAQPEHCGGRWPDDDKHFPGRLRGCFGAKARSTDIRYEMPFTRRETEMGKDNDAYERLVKNGVQPPRVDGSAELESRIS